MMSNWLPPLILTANFQFWPKIGFDQDQSKNSVPSEKRGCVAKVKKLIDSFRIIEWTFNL